MTQRAQITSASTDQRARTAALVLVRQVTLRFSARRQERRSIGLCNSMYRFTSMQFFLRRVIETETAMLLLGVSCLLLIPSINEAHQDARRCRPVNRLNQHSRCHPDAVEIKNGRVSEVSACPTCGRFSAPCAIAPPRAFFEHLTSPRHSTSPTFRTFGVILEEARLELWFYEHGTRVPRDSWRDRDRGASERR